MRTILVLAAALLLSSAAKADEAINIASGASACGFASCSNLGATELRISPPEQGAVLISEGGELVARIGRFSTLSVPSGRSYEVTAVKGPFILWRAGIAASGGTIELSWSDGAVPVVRHVPPPPPVIIGLPAPQHRPVGMHRKAFRTLLETLQNADFESDKLKIVQTAAAQGRFTIAQVGRILGHFDFESDRLKALEALRPHVIDPENGFSIAEHFTFSSSKKKALALFAQPLATDRGIVNSASVDRPAASRPKRGSRPQP